MLFQSRLGADLGWCLQRPSSGQGQDCGSMEIPSCMCEGGASCRQVRRVRRQGICGAWQFKHTNARAAVAFFRVPDLGTGFEVFRMGCPVDSDSLVGICRKGTAAAKNIASMHRHVVSAAQPALMRGGREEAERQLSCRLHRTKYVCTSIGLKRIVTGGKICVQTGSEPVLWTASLGEAFQR